MIRGLVLVLAMVACAQGAEFEDPLLVGPFVLHAGAPELEPCGMAFDPVPELLDATQRAAERWSAATGCDVRVEAGSSAVELWPAVYAFERTDGSFEARASDDIGDGLEICAGMFGGAIYVSASKLYCPDLDVVVAHEMGHGFGEPNTHADTGVMRSNPREGSHAIDSGSLVWACSTTLCPEFRPEDVN